MGGPIYGNGPSKPGVYQIKWKFLISIRTTTAKTFKRILDGRTILSSLIAGISPNPAGPPGPDSNSVYRDAMVRAARRTRKCPVAHVAGIGLFASAVRRWVRSRLGRPVTSCVLGVMMLVAFIASKERLGAAAVPTGV